MPEEVEDISFSCHFACYIFFKPEFSFSNRKDLVGFNAFFDKMVVKDNFKVVIAGGSITGLALANMLQLYNIDFVVLEAYPDITPQVGASIGILPHGNRILDQLGLFENILDLCPPLDSFHFRKQSGHVIREFRGMNASMYER